MTTTRSRSGHVPIPSHGDTAVGRWLKNRTNLTLTIGREPNPEAVAGNLGSDADRMRSVLHAERRIDQAARGGAPATAADPDESDA